jgi:hypothetical protein
MCQPLFRGIGPTIKKIAQPRNTIISNKVSKELTAVFVMGFSTGRCVPQSFIDLNFEQHLPPMREQGGQRD